MCNVQDALALAERDWPVLPLKPNSKRPAIKDWPNRATCDVERVKQWWTEMPDANVGIATGNGFVVIDLDVKNGVNGIATWEALCQEHGIECHTFTVTTPTGGRHLYFSVNGTEIRNSAGKLGPGIDVRGTGGYAVSPPSTTPDGAYTWQGGDMCSLPQAILDLLTKKKTEPPLGRPPGLPPDRTRSPYVQAAVDAELEQVRRAPEGTRNDTLNNAAFALGQLVAAPWANLDRAAVEGELLAAARACGLPAHEATATAQSGLDAGMQQPRLEPVDNQQRATAKEPLLDQEQSNAKQRGRPRSPKLLTQDYIELYRQWGYKVRLNLCNDDIEMNNEKLSDILEDQLMARVRDYGITQRVGINVKHAREALSTLAAAQAYHPIRDYLNGLKWDGRDHIGNLVRYFTDADGRFLRWFGHWIVGAVAKVFDGFQNPMLVIDGPQEMGKSYFARWLCPLERNFYAGAIYPENKDCKLRLMDTWVWEVEELGTTTRKADVEALKAFLTLQMVRDRKPYGHRDTVKPALSSFVGTINNEAGFLTDRTGNRRFLVCTIDRIDWAYTDQVDVNQLWAQAAALYKTTGGWKLTRCEKRERDERNTEYMVDDPVEAFLGEILTYTGNPSDSVTLPELLELLREKCTVNQKAQAMTIASVLKSWGAVKKRAKIKGNGRSTVFYGVKLST